VAAAADRDNAGARAIPRLVTRRPVVEACESPNDLAALVYAADDDPDALLRDFVAELTAGGRRVVGLIQHGHQPDATQLSAIMVHTGEGVNLFQDLGVHAAGCRLDVQALTRAGSEIAAAIEEGADLLVINRFGKQEREGKGLLYLIEQALSAGIPVVVAVPDHCLDTWTVFAGDMSVSIAANRDALQDWWRGVASQAAGASGELVL
jgi:hypothetical protein